MASVPITGVPPVNPGGSPDTNLLHRLPIVKAAADRHKVPLVVLWGVYGIETNFGTNVKTSSAGAMGHFQFTPDTAKAYNYPLTNHPTEKQFEAQADGAARYLADLKKQKGSWDAAIHGYSAGPHNPNPKAGYGLAEVTKKVKDNPDVTSGNVISTPLDNVNPLAAFDGLKAIGAFFLALLQHDTWLRILKVAGGAAFLYLGLVRLGAPLPTHLPKPI